MGASGWSHRVDHDPDVDAALRRLQHGFVTALDAAVHDELFGTTQPTVEAVEAELLDIDDHLEARWQGVYVVGWADGAPAALFFVGVSGD